MVLGYSPTSIAPLIQSNLATVVEPFAMTTTRITASRTTCVSIAIFAWNEEAAIGRALGSLFEQTLFAELADRALNCEVLCVVNGCTDRTPEIAAKIFAEQKQGHPFGDFFSGRVINLTERGKINAWNQFVHSVSSRESQFLFMMDADIIIPPADTLRNMLRALEEHSEASVSIDRPRKDISFKKRKSVREHLSLAASQTTFSAEAQLCGQLYCIRADVARNIYLPKDLAACEDGFIKTLVCTDFLTHAVAPERIRLAEGAEHLFEAYTSPAAIFKNQKRQMMGQTIVHLLVDDYLKSLPLSERLRLGQTLREKETADPLWLKRLISEHMARTRFFWQLYPGLLSHRFRQLGNLRPLQGLTAFPAAAAGFFVGLVAAFMAWRALKRGCTNYWPQRSAPNSAAPQPVSPTAGLAVGNSFAGPWPQCAVQKPGRLPSNHNPQ